MSSILKITENRPWLAWILFFATIVVVFLLGLLASSIVERRAEAAFVNVPKKPLNQFDPRNEVWGENFPREFQSYYQTADTSFRSKYNGNAPIDMLEEDPELVVLWAGYAFSKDYKITSLCIFQQRQRLLVLLASWQREKATNLEKKGLGI